VADKPASSDVSLGWAVIGICFLGALWLLWHFQEYNIKNVVRWMHVGEMWVMSLFIDTNTFSVPYRGETQLMFNPWYQFAQDAPKETLSNEVMSQIALLSLAPFRYIFSGLLLLLGFIILFRGPRSMYRRRHDINSLLTHQAKNFPYIAPFVHFNPNNQKPRAPGDPVPAELPLFAEALSPEEWVTYNEIPVPDGKIDADLTTKAFTKQLGTPWRGYQHLEPYKQVLLASFCLKSIRKREAADMMLGKLAKCWTAKNGLRVSAKLTREARSILNNRSISGDVLSKCNQHAYEHTALLRGLQTAREQGGVLAPATFVWLRGHDRYLWYPLNNLGRQAFHVEALGAMAHFKAEKLTSRPIPRPKVDDAVLNLSNFISSKDVRPIPPLDYSNSKKAGIKKVKGSK
jgi:intracellular multiplication protein IcmP